MKEQQLTNEELFYKNLDQVYKLININRSFWASLDAINKALSALELNLNNLENLNKADVYNLLLFAKIFQRKIHRRGENRNNTKIKRLNKYLEELSYLSSERTESVKR